MIHRQGANSPKELLRQAQPGDHTAIANIIAAQNQVVESHCIQSSAKNDPQMIQNEMQRLFDQDELRFVVAESSGQIIGCLVRFIPTQATRPMGLQPLSWVNRAGLTCSVNEVEMLAGELHRVLNMDKLSSRCAGERFMVHIRLAIRNDILDNESMDGSP
jgi:hypothetical protein